MKKSKIEKKKIKKTPKFIIKEIIRWGSLAAFIGCVTIILVESAIPGQQSADQSGGVADQIEDDINDGYDKENLIEIVNFNINFENEQTEFFIGDELSYSIEYAPENTSYKTIDWSVSDSTIASVDQTNNVISFLSAGDVKITAKSQRNLNLVKTFDFKVKEVPVSNIELEVTNLTLNINDVHIIQSVVLPENASNKNLIYTSSNQNVATVNENGIITAKNAGSAEILIKSESTPDVFATINVKVNESVSFETNVISHPNVDVYPTQTITTEGIYGPEGANFNFKNLIITKINDDSNYLTIKTKSINNSKSTFSLTVNAKQNAVPCTIDVKLTYLSNETTIEHVFKVNILEQTKLTKEFINEDKIKFDYTSSIYENTYYTGSNNIILAETSIDVPYNSSVTSNQYKYDLKSFSWTTSEHFTITSSKFNKVNIKPIKAEACEGWVEYKLLNDEDFKIKFNISYTIVEDDSKITNITLDKLYTQETDNKVNKLFINQEYEDILNPKIVAEGKFPSSFTSTGVIYEIPSTSKDLIEFIYTNNKISGIKTLNNSGSAEILVISKYESELGIKSPLTRTIELEITNNPNTSVLLVNDQQYEDFDENLLIKRNEEIYVQFELSNIVTLKDGTKYENNVNAPFSTKISESNVISYNKESSIVSGLDAGTVELSFILEDTSLSFLNKTIKIQIDYVKISSISFSYLLSTEVPYNTITSDYSKVPVGTSFIIHSTINEDATDKRIEYVSSNEEILKIDSISGLVTTLKPGTATIKAFSVDDPNIYKEKTITVTKTTSPFRIDFEGLETENIEAIRENDKLVGYYLKVYYGKSYKLKYETAIECTSNTFKATCVSESNKNVVIIDESGNLSTENLGDSTIKITFGDDECIDTYSLTLNLKVVRKTISYSELHTLVRKLLGHFGLFLGTAATGMVFICMTWKPWWKKLVATAIYTVIGFAVAAGSEGIQALTPGRGPSWKDVGIDFGGFVSTTGTFLIIFASIILIKFIIKKYKENKLKAIEKAKLPPKKPTRKFIVMKNKKK